MGLFKTFVEYITSSKLEESKEEIGMLKQQLIDKERKLNIAKEWQKILADQYNVIRSRFKDSQARHSGYLFYRDKYIETNIALIQQTKRVEELSNFIESINPLTKILDNAMIEIEELNNSTTWVKKQEEQIKYESNESIEEQIAKDFDNLKQLPIPASSNEHVIEFERKAEIEREYSKKYFENLNNPEHFINTRILGTKGNWDITDNNDSPTRSETNQ